MITEHTNARNARKPFRFRVVRVFVLLAAASPLHAGAQTLTQRGFAEGSAVAFPQEAPNDSTRLVGDFLLRDDVFLKTGPWLQLAAGAELRANSYGQVEDDWRVDFSDRGVRRPRLSIRRAAATITHGPFVVDAGKQFIRWGRTDVVTPTDRFAPRDFLNVFDNEFLAVTGVRGAAQHGAETLDAVWVPRFTPSRVPLVDQRWTVLPAGVSVPAQALPRALPDGSQVGVRWNHTGAGLDWSAAFFDGFNHLPNIEATGLTYPAMRMYGGDAAVPTRWATLKGETAWFTSSSPATDEYVMYVIQIERQTGEWVLVGGYAGEAVTAHHASTPVTFAPDRGMTRSIVGRASYTIDVNRSVAIEAAVRTSGDGEYGKVEYSHAYGQHWRATGAAVLIAGHSGDFLGQYHDNSHATAAVRYSF